MARGGVFGAPSGRARAAAPDTDGDRHDAPGPRPSSSSAPARPGATRVSGGGGRRGLPLRFPPEVGEAGPTEARGQPCPHSRGPGETKRRRRECPRRRDGRWAASGQPALSARPSPPRLAPPRPPPPAQIRGRRGQCLCRGGSGVHVWGKVAAALRAAGCARVVRAPHVLGKQLPICTEPVSARRCLQTQPKCSTCTSPTQDGSPSTPKRARRAPLSLAPLSLQAYFGCVCGGRVSIKSGSRARGRLLPSRCSYRPSEHCWRGAASTQVFPPGRAAAARGLAAEGRPRPVPRGRRRSRSAQEEGAKAQRLGCRLDVPGRGKEIPLERNCSMSWSSSDFGPSAEVFGKNGVLEEQKFPRFKKRETQVYIGNLPLDISEEEIRCLLKDFNPLRVHKIQNGCKCFAFVDVGSMQKVALAIQELNGKLFRKRKLYVNSNRSPKRTLDVTECTQELLGLEKTSGQGFARTTACTQLVPKASVDPCKTEKPRTSIFAVPMEMSDGL
ncbi:tudor domain-containing protein 10 isoform X5 [Sagmatias obliquidens]|uniref:tudor domain-containing protein 10 isoform X5 n=1 Tax=Sagmatias obliquidens TaxID=3371155 RepID=UPI000F442551|nr:tudor domain-containing protein 10 isoform X5 [Lagenorhynchus obliquidens]